MTLFLPCLAGERLRQAHRLDQLLGLAQVPVGAGVGHVRREQARADELLGDGAGAPLASPARPLGDRRHDRRRVEPAIRPEGVVLGGRRGVEEEWRHLAERDDPPFLAREPSELDRSGPVVDDRGLGERQRLQASRVGETDRQHADRGAEQDDRGGDRDDHRQGNDAQHPGHDLRPPPGPGPAACGAAGITECHDPRPLTVSGAGRGAWSVCGVGRHRPMVDAMPSSAVWLT